MFNAPNGKPSNLNETQWKLVRTPEFKSWFGDWEKLAIAKVKDPAMDEVTLANLSKDVSKVVDDNGEPLVVYHTSKNQINIFRVENEINTLSGKTINAKGAYFTAYPKMYEYKGGNLIKCFLNIKNPKITTDQLFSALINEDKYRLLNANGNDGVVLNLPFKNEKNTEIVVFEPNQIKLADGTNTTFDGSNPDIRFDDGGLIAPNGKKSNLTAEQYKLVRTKAFKDWFGDWENDPENASKVVDENGEPLMVYHGSRSDVKFAFPIFDIGKDDISFFTNDKRVAEWFSGGSSHILRFEELKIPNSLNQKSSINDLLAFYKEKIDPTAFLEKRNISDGTIFYRLSHYDGMVSSPLGENMAQVKKELYKKILHGVNIANNSTSRPFYRVFLKIKKPYVIDAKGNDFMSIPFENGLYDAESVIKTIKKRGKNDGVIIKNNIEGTDAYYQKTQDTYSAFEPNQIKLADGTNTTFDDSNPDIRYDYGGEVNSNSFMKWYVQWYKGISDKMNIVFSLPSVIAPYKEENVVVLDVFEKINQNIDAKPYLKEIVEKADEYGVVIYLEPTPRHNRFQDNLEKKKKITREYLIEYYKRFGFQLTPNKQFMKRLPKSNPDIRFDDGGKVPQYEIVSEAYYENEIDDLFGGDLEHIYEWSEGVGRGLTNYDIFKSNEKYILRISDYGFDGYNNRYYIINYSNPDNRYNNGGTMKKVDKGGITYGKSHDEGGIPVKNASTGQMLEVEGGEGIVNKRSMSSQEKVNLDGKKLTICEAVSELNQKGGGVKFDCDIMDNKRYSYNNGGEFKKGKKMELEHKDTLDKLYAKEITTDEAVESIVKEHLQENPKYYSSMEKFTPARRKKKTCACTKKYYEDGGDIFDLGIGSMDSFVRSQISKEKRDNEDQEIIDWTINEGRKMLDTNILSSLMSVDAKWKPYFAPYQKFNLYELGWRLQFGSSRQWAGLCSWDGELKKNIYLSIQFVKHDRNWKQNAIDTIHHEIAHACVTEAIISKVGMIAYRQIDPLYFANTGHGDSWKSICQALNIEGDCSVFYTKSNKKPSFLPYKYECANCFNKGYGNRITFTNTCFKCFKPVTPTKNLV